MGPAQPSTHGTDLTHWYWKEKWGNVKPHCMEKPEGRVWEKDNSSQPPLSSMDSYPPRFFSCTLVLGQWQAERQELLTGSIFWEDIRTRSSSLMLAWLHDGLLAVWTWICWVVPITDLPLRLLFPKLWWFVSSIRLAGALSSHLMLSECFLHFCLHGDFMPGWKTEWSKVVSDINFWKGALHNITFGDHCERGTCSSPPCCSWAAS